MNWLNILQRKYGRYGIRNLMLYIVLGNALIFILMTLDHRIFASLALHPGLVLQGQVWRLVSFIFIPPSLSLIWIFFALYFYYMVGTGLEQEWGTFKFNIYYLTGMLGTILAAFLVAFGIAPLLPGISGAGFFDAFYLNLSLFLAFAHIYPNFEIRLFMVLPVKVKYLAWLNWAFILYTLLFGAIPQKVLAVVPIANYFLYFGHDLTKDMRRRRMVRQNRKKFFSEIRKVNENRDKKP